MSADDSTPPPLPPPAPASDRVFTVTYDEFAGQSFEATARGPGSLVIQGTGPAATYTFTGPPPPSASLGGGVEFVFSAEKIKNVAAEGTCIKFVGTLRSGLAPEQPFAFHCATPAEAAALARLFPSTRDAEFAADQEFDVRLARLPAARSPGTSVTGLLIIVNVVIFIAMGFAGAGWIMRADMAPYIHYGANRVDVTTDGQWWRLVTSMFLHYGIIHLALNMWALFQAGLVLERLLGRTLYTFVYFGSGLTGSLVTLLWHRAEGVWSAGASGAVFGVFGALVGYMLHEKHALPKNVWQPMLSSMVTAIGYNLVFGVVVSGIDNAAHVGGLLGGLALGWLVALPLDIETRRRLLGPRLAVGAAVLAAVVTLGVIAAPRFDYHLIEEMAWDQAFPSQDVRSSQLSNALYVALRTHQPGRPNPDLVRLLTQEVIPFTENWIKTITALPLDPERRTARRRELLIRTLQLRLEAYQHVLTAVQKSAPDVVAIYNRDMRPAHAAYARYAMLH